MEGKRERAYVGIGIGRITLEKHESVIHSLSISTLRGLQLIAADIGREVGMRLMVMQEAIGNLHTRISISTSTEATQIHQSRLM